MAFREDLAQQHGFLHAAILTAIADTACGYAALTTMAPDKNVLTAEYKMNFLAPAIGDRFVATGRVVKAGRTLTVCTGDVVAHRGGDCKQITVMLATMAAVQE